jgi:hypothetical protein
MDSVECTGHFGVKSQLTINHLQGI